MKRLLSIALLVLGPGLLLGVVGCRPETRVANSPLPTPVSTLPPSVLSTPIPLTTPTLTSTPTATPTLPPIAWSSPPACVGRPQGSACTRLLYLRWPNFIVQSMWASTGISESAVFTRPLTADFNLTIDRLVPSPDYRRIAVETSGYEKGGPIYLVNMDTRQLVKLDPFSALGDRKKLPYGGLDSWQVIGWHPDGQHLLIGPDLAGGVYWVDLASNTYSLIRLAGSDGVGGRDFVDLKPDGSGFAYITGGADGNQRVDYLDLRNQQVTTLFTFPFNEGVLRYPRFSPSGNSIAYLTETGHPTTELTQAIRLVDLSSGVNRDLVTGALGSTEPVWSPDGQMIAFARKDSALPVGHWSPDNKTWLGNIWSVSVASGGLQQRTYIQGAARRPTWSLDGRYLSFLTHDGQIGLTPLDQPGVIWRVGVGSAESPASASVLFLP
jgi:hypothetical protein